MTEKNDVIKHLEQLCDEIRTGRMKTASAGYTLRRMDWIGDAIALLKTQEPRVLALDEIHSGMTVWLEDVDKTDVMLAIVVVPDGICRCFITADNRRISPSNNDYRVRWRAWTSEPTNVQRKAVKWE